MNKYRVTSEKDYIKLVTNGMYTYRIKDKYKPKSYPCIVVIEEHGAYISTIFIYEKDFKGKSFIENSMERH